jgi:hypothetical protein
MVAVPVHELLNAWKFANHGGYSTAAAYKGAYSRFKKLLESRGALEVTTHPKVLPHHWQPWNMVSQLIDGRVVMARMVDQGACQRQSRHFPRCSYPYPDGTLHR